jgi:hypothetical protein
MRDSSNKILVTSEQLHHFCVHEGCWEYLPDNHEYLKQSLLISATVFDKRDRNPDCRTGPEPEPPHIPQARSKRLTKKQFRTDTAETATLKMLHWAWISLISVQLKFTDTFLAYSSSGVVERRQSRR